MPSHIGFESAIGADCWTLTRSLVAENSPYYETGAKLSFTNKNENLTVATLLLNGWQRTHRPNGYNKPALGLQLNYKLTDQLTVNYSNFIGSDKPDDADVQRIYHNFYAQWQGKDWGLTAGVDSGREGDLGNWWTPVLLLRWEMAEDWRLAGRLEYFSDPDQVLVSTGTPNGFEVTGASLNLDHRLNDYALLRFEGRHFNAKDELFIDRGAGATTGNFALVAALCVRW
nr:porin [Saprospiraceae bacterium]